MKVKVNGRDGGWGMDVAGSMWSIAMQWSPVQSGPVVSWGEGQLSPVLCACTHHHHHLLLLRYIIYLV